MQDAYRQDCNFESTQSKLKSEETNKPFECKATWPPDTLLSEHAKSTINKWKPSIEYFKFVSGCRHSFKQSYHSIKKKKGYG